MRIPLSRLLVIALVGLAVACSEKPAEPEPARPFDITPKEVTIDLNGSVLFKAPTDQPIYRYEDITWTSTNPSVHRRCTTLDVSLSFCANAPGTTTLTFKYIDGRTGTVTLTVRPARIKFSSNGAFVVGYASSVTASVTNPARPFVSFRSLDTNVAIVAGVTASQSENRAQLLLKRAGSFDLEIVAADDPTMRDTVHLTVAAKRAASVVFPATQNVAEGRNQYVLSVVIRDQLDGTLYDLTPIVTVVEGDAVARVVSVAPQSDGNASALVTIAPATAAVATVRVTIDGVSAAVPVVFRVAARDSAVATAGGAAVADVAANDFPHTAPPSIVQQPAHGSATLVATGIRYVPAAGHIGLDSMRYAATSGSRTDSSWVRFVTMPGLFDVKVIGGGDLQPVDLNDRGDVAGTLTLGDGTLRAFRWISGRLDTLDFNGIPTEATGIDNQGNVVGLAVLPPPATGPLPLPTPVLWRSSGQTGEALLDHVPGGFPDRSRISRSGVIAVPDYPNIVVIRGAQRKSVNLGFVWLDGVNDRGDILYTTLNDGSTSIQFDDGRQVYIAGASHTRGRGTWLRNDGTALMNQSTSNGFGPTGPVLFDGTAARYLRSPFGNWIAGVHRLNADGWILGTATTAPGSIVPALFIKDAGAPLSKLVAPGVTVLSAPAMNEAGQILAAIIDPSAGKQLVVYTPQKR